LWCSRLWQLWLAIALRWRVLFSQELLDGVVEVLLKASEKLLVVGAVPLQVPLQVKLCSSLLVSCLISRINVVSPPLVVSELVALALVERGAARAVSQARLLMPEAYALVARLGESKRSHLRRFLWRNFPVFCLGRCRRDRAWFLLVLTLLLRVSLFVTDLGDLDPRKRWRPP